MLENFRLKAFRADLKVKPWFEDELLLSDRLALA
jgi:hypothetical protein